MLQYVIAGLALGGIYAIASAGLVITYISAGVLNFAFGALAYFVARLYYYLLVQQHWGILPAALFSILFAGPAMGVTLYFALFRFLRLSSPLVKIVATLGLATMIPYLAILCFGNETILSAPGLAPRPVKVFHVDGVPVDMDKIIVYGCVILVVVLGGAILRYTDIGLRVRAMVDSPAMTSLSGTNPTAVSVGVWAVSIFLAGLSGVLSAPQVGMDPGAYTLLMASAFAAVIAAKLRSLPVAVIVALLMGVAADLIIHYMPPSSSFTAAVIPSIPFVVTALFLVYHTVRTGRVSETAGVGGALDRAIAVQGGERLGGATVDPDRPSSRALGWGPALFGVAVAALLPLFLHGVWITSLATGIAFGVIFLSFTLVTGEGGMIWLCMITFAGVGALTAGRMVDHYHWPVLAGVLFGGILALPMGVIIGMLTIRMGDLYVALVTLTFGLLMENLVFSRSIFLNFGMGQTLPRPGFATSDRAFSYLGLVVFAIIGVFIVNLRRSTTGMALTAVKWSEPGSKTIGVSVLQTKVLVAGLAAFVAGIGGALLAVAQGTATPSNYATLAGVVWLAVLVMQGIRSNTAALVAGLTFTLLPTLVQTYLPVWVGNIPPILFGLGAIGVARNPDGVMAMQVRQLRALVGLVRGHRKGAGGVSPPEKQESPVPATASLTGSGAV
ncbi:MAG TPA: ABC transporter permease [Acidimicrobiales bacterium]|nr:ABC transporter permease [Acidimicrobiales bacterium]